MSDLLALAERCEAAQGPDREIDGEIAKALMPDREWHRFEDTWGCRSITDDAAFDMPDEYTRSLDAAMTLVPEGWRTAALCEREPWFCRLETADFKSVTWGKGSDWITDIIAGQEVMAKAATPALALCAAALRARAEQ